jgi:perosamine synthetase
MTKNITIFPMSQKISKQNSLIINFIRSEFETNEFIPLHEPRFCGNEKKYLNQCIDSTFVSSVGEFVNRFEDEIAKFTGSKFAIATSNGTSALHISLLISGVCNGNEVITQPLTFVATCNAIQYCNAIPIFVDVDKDTMGMSPEALKKFLNENAIIENQKCINKTTGNIIKACVPMHTYGNPCRIKEILEICNQWHIKLIEDAAESLGSQYDGAQTGTFGELGVVSFNGNKIITSGGGGCILTNNEYLAKAAKHITTTAKVPHKWDFIHDMVGYNYRMPNLNAALLVAQLEQINEFIISKRELAKSYESFFETISPVFFTELKNSKSNYWLNSILLDNKAEKKLFLEETNSQGVMTRPTWTLMNKLSIYKKSICGNLENAHWFEDRLVNIPSSVII